MKRGRARMEGPDAEELIDIIAERAVKAYRNVTDEALVEARKALVDAVAVAAAAAKLDPTAYRMAKEFSKGYGEHLVLGLWERSGLMESVAANAFLAHSLELDDWLAPAYVHAGSVLVPLVLGLAPRKPLGEVLRLLVAGYEVAYYVGSLLGREHYRFWHSTATAGSAAAAALAALALDGGEGELTAAIELALTYMGGLWSVNRAEALYKPLSPVNAALTGLVAAKAARVGKARVPGAVADACKRYHAVCRLPETDELGIMFNGFKFYPACRHTHTAIEAAERLSKQLGEDHRGVELIEVITFEEAARVAGKPWPVTLHQARFSLKFLVAVVLVYGHLGFSELKQGMSNTSVRRLYEHVKVAVSDEYTELYPDQQPTTIRLKLKDGRLLEETVYVPKGDPKRRPSLEDIVSKAAGLAKEAGDHRIAVLANAIAKAALGDTLSGAIEAAVD